MPPEARIHEPLTTLDGGADGLDIQRRVAAGAPFWLARGGHLILETSRSQEARTMEIVREHRTHPTGGSLKKAGLRHGSHRNT